MLTIMRVKNILPIIILFGFANNVIADEEKIDGLFIAGVGTRVGISDASSFEMHLLIVDFGIQHKNVKIVATTNLNTLIIYRLLNLSYKIIDHEIYSIDIFCGGGMEKYSSATDYIYNLGFELGYKNFYIPIGVTYHSFTEYPLNDVEGNPIETDEKLRKNDKYFSFFTGFGYRVAF